MTWRKQPDERGLEAVGQSPRGAILKVDGEDIGRVYANRKGFAQEWDGWYWVARSVDDKVPLKNTAVDGKFFEDIEDAKRDCKDYVLSMLSRTAKE